jgi:hypothetical protein
MEKEITYNGRLLTVIGEYQPYEAMVLYYPDGSGYPGCPSYFEPEQILEDGVDITDTFRQEQLDEIENLVLESIEE